MSDRIEELPARPRPKLSHLTPYISSHWKALLAAVLLSLLGAAASLTQPLLVSALISAVQASGEPGSLVWLLTGLVVAAGSAAGVQAYLLQRAGEGVVLTARRRLASKLLRLPVSEFDRRRTGDLIARVSSDTTLLRGVLSQGVVESVGAAITVLGAFIAMLILDPVLLGLTAAVVAISGVIVIVLSARIRPAIEQAQVEVGALTSALERAIRAIRTIRAANATDRELSEIDGRARAAWRVGVKVAKISALVVPVGGIALQVSILVILGVGGYRVASGAIAVADLVAFVLFLFLMLLPLVQLFSAITALNEAFGALGRIHEVLDLPSETDLDVAAPAVLPGMTPDPVSRHQGLSVEFENVTFAYTSAPEILSAGKTSDENDGSVPDSEVGDLQTREVLHGLTFSAPAGKRTAIVGPSGAGKSTVFSLLERFYDPSEGAVRVGGVDIRSLGREQLREKLGYVEQDAPVLAGTLRDNLLLGNPTATDEECVDALASVNLNDVLERDPERLDAQVVDGGVLLSGGERQRLAIARCLLASPPILLLDESSSNLDGLSEQRMRQAIDAVAEGRTLLVIAHRLATVVDADQIIVLDRGRVVGIGTHEQLLDTTALYRSLAAHQLLTN
ncbi:ABC transporter ATP-binding protein [Lysobacter korlensis]|uniref:ABC transporter ATP-binding protein n=1 Tax=Lysobacter korlensis TaxID=553636 RepID=A0ABV6RWF0_9GAMM